jgi:ABC-type sugar transport system ATPase subunit
MQAGDLPCGVVAGVRLSNVSKRFGDVTAVDNVVLDIGDREFMVLLGPSGCGKSTLLRMVAGLEDPTEGEIWIGDQLVNDVPPKQRDIAMVFQSYALYPHKTVQANIEFPLKARGVGTRERSHAAREAAQVLGLSELLGRKPGALSGGQRQRVALARAIVRNPAVFLMDEPLSNLDAKLRGETRAELIALHQRVEGTFVYVTHDQVEAMTMGTRVAVMQRGVLEQVGPPQDVYDKPASLFVAQFLGTPPMNVFPAGTLERSDVLVGVRPEHITLDREGPLTARVLLVEALGYERLITCVLPNEARVVARTNDVDGPREGEAVFIDAEPRHRHHFDPVTGKRQET